MAGSTGCLFPSLKEPVATVQLPSGISRKRIKQIRWKLPDRGDRTLDQVEDPQRAADPQCPVERCEDVPHSRSVRRWCSRVVGVPLRTRDRHLGGPRRLRFLGRFGGQAPGSGREA